MTLDVAMKTIIPVVSIRQNRRKPGGFTLIEVLVVVAIIGLLVAVLLPSLSRAREQARVAVCRSNLRTLGQSLVMYADANRDKLPNANLPGTDVTDPASEQANTIVMMGMTRKYRLQPDVFHCPMDESPAPEAIETVAYTAPDSARVSYDFYSFWWYPEYGPNLTDMNQAPLAWDLDGGSAAPTWLQNHGIKGGNVVFGDTRVEWQPQVRWDRKNIPHPGNRFWKGPGK
jgi:prepilin-type N-terminal cleavage/methylation domain-containing protein